ncbi:diacylglycerol/lipid kinase family protein [Tellurirhabdus rosea]|uniref:diacylglycerol/lipid kinase family protein n=1 Tax=Tellurirhabdus rosea TaxID=2674997 RepID=UPI00225A90CD|nr:diacylglycerol kinase family protein [Tellurirhabdus rosea]
MHSQRSIPHNQSVPPEGMLKLLFVINPVSGGRAKDDWEEQIRDFFRNKPFSPDFLVLNGQNDEESVRKAVESLKPDRVVAVGGDGTIKLVAEQLLEPEIPLGILPAGSANGMARELGLPSALEEALEVIASGHIQPLDVILINKKDICLHLSDIGLNAQLVKYYKDNNWRGKLGYARGILRVLLNRRSLHVRLITDERVLHREAVMVVLANARMYGTGAIINPEGELTDGQFEVVVMREVSYFEFLKMFWRFRPFDPTKIEILKASSLDITTRKRAYFQIDGEYRGRIRQVTAEMLPGKLKVITREEEA